MTGRHISALDILVLRRVADDGRTLIGPPAPPLVDLADAGLVALTRPTDDRRGWVEVTETGRAVLAALGQAAEATLS